MKFVVNVLPKGDDLGPPFFWTSKQLGNLA